MVTKINNYMLLIANVLLVFVLGVAVGASLAGQNTANQQKFVQAGWDAAKTRLMQSGMYPAEISNYEMKGISGKLMEATKDFFKIKIRPLEPLSDPDLDVRIALINPNTELFKMVEKEKSVYDKELAEYEKKVKAGEDKSIGHPVPYDKIGIKWDEFKTGDNVSVYVGDKINDKKSFTAKIIYLTPEIKIATTSPVVVK